MTLRGGRPAYSQTASEHPGMPSQHGVENRANRQALFETHGVKTPSNAKVMRDEEGGFNVTDGLSLGARSYPAQPRETEMGKPDAFGRTRKVFKGTNRIVNNESNEAAWARTIQDAERAPR